MPHKRKIHAVVLAGGFGTRLSPLTDSVPKPLVRILDTTVLENVLCGILKTQAEKITVSTFYKAEMIEETIRCFGDKVVCKKENVPLGTAGGVKNCCESECDAVLVVSGDAVFDFDLQKIIDAHFEAGNDMTVCTCRKSDPTQYGVVITDETGNVVCLDEKPSWKKVRSDLVNTGIYALSRNVLDEIPDNMPYDFSKNLIPKLLKQGRKIGSFTAFGYWCDIGTLDEYYKCNRDAARQEFLLSSDNKKNVRELRDKGIHAEDGVYVSQSASIGKNVRLCDSSVVGEKAVVSDNCDVDAALIGRSVHVGKGTSINSSIVADNTFISDNCIIQSGCVIGHNCRIGEGTVLKKGTRLAPGSITKAEDKRVAEFSGNDFVFVSDGKAVLDSVEMPESLIRFGASVSASFRKNGSRSTRLALMSDNGFEAAAFVSGLLLQGTDIYNLGEGNEALCRFSAPHVRADVYAFAECNGKRCYITLFDKNGDYISGDDERKISKVYLTFKEQNLMQTQINTLKSPVAVPVMSLYKNSLSCFAEELAGAEGFSGMEVCVLGNTVGTQMNFFKEVFSELSGHISPGKSEDGMCVYLGEDGMLSGVEYKNAVLDINHVYAVVLNNLEVLGISAINLPTDVPDILRNVVLSKGCSMKAAASLCDNMFFDDAVLLIMLLSVVSLRAESIGEMCKEIPDFEIYADEYIADINKGAVMERLSRLYASSKNDGGDGISLSLAEGNVTVIPNRAKGFKIVSEAQSMEMAKELCIKIGKAIKNEE